MKKLILTLAAVGVLMGVSAREADAQLPHDYYASCAGGALGCSQVDFFIDLLGGASASIDYFWVELLSPGWAFEAPFWGGEAEDANGDAFFFPLSVTGSRIEGEFPFGAFLDPSLRFRAEMATYQSNLSSFSFDCEGSEGGQVVFDCSGAVGPVVPEPATVILLGTGLVGLVGFARRRRRIDDVEVAGD